MLEFTGFLNTQKCWQTFFSLLMAAYAYFAFYFVFICTGGTHSALWPKRLLAMYLFLPLSLFLCLCLTPFFSLSLLLWLCRWKCCRVQSCYVFVCPYGSLFVCIFWGGVLVHLTNREEVATWWAGRRWVGDRTVWNLRRAKAASVNINHNVLACYFSCSND